MYRIMIVEDDAVIAGMIGENLRSWGFDVQIAGDLQNVMAEFRRLQPHLVLMDISLPFCNGYYWCGEIRKTSNAPVIFISSHSDNMDIVMAINMGGDDYITKPLSMDVLVAKIKAMLRRSYDYELPLQHLMLKDVSLDVAGGCLVRGTQRVNLTKNELHILLELLLKKGQIVSREKIMLKLWDSYEFVDDNTLTVNINRLRKTLNDAGLDDCIMTHKGQGYSIHA